MPIAIAADGEVELEGSDLTALVYALKRFTTDYPRADLKNFFVFVEVPHDRSKAQVAFVPHPEPQRAGHLELHLGGGNKFGEEVHYEMSRKPLKVLRVWYGK
jgi:hypothetical protein